MRSSASNSAASIATRSNKRSAMATTPARDGRAQWLVRGTTADGTPFETIYDHPHDGDVDTVRIVSGWRLL